MTWTMIIVCQRSSQLCSVYTPEFRTLLVSIRTLITEYRTSQDRLAFCSMPLTWDDINDHEIIRTAENKLEYDGYVLHTALRANLSHDHLGVCTDT